MAKKNVSDIVSGAGWIAGFADKLVRGLRDRGVSNEQIHSLVTDAGEPAMEKIVEEVFNFLRGELTISEPSRPWREENGVIYFSVVSDGTTGENWISRLETKGFRASDYAKIVLRSSDFHTTNGVTTNVAVLKDSLFTDEERITKTIREKVCAGVFTEGRKLSTPNPEVACLIREKFSDEDIEAMDLLWIVVMHDPIKDPDGDPSFLSACRGGDGRWLNARWAGPSRSWSSNVGFAFAVSQVAF